MASGFPESVPAWYTGPRGASSSSSAAGLAVLAELDDDVYATIEARAAALTSGLAAGLTAAGLAVTAPRAFTLAGLFFAATPVRNYDDARACDTERYGALFRHLLGRGIYVAPSQFEAMFVSLAHSDDDVDATVAAVRAFSEAAA